MEITIKAIKKAQKWAEKTCTEHGTWVTLYFDPRYSGFSMIEHTDGNSWSPLPDGAIAIPFQPDQDDVSAAIGADTNAEFLRRLQARVERRAVRILRSSGVEVLEAEKTQKTARTYEDDFCR